MRLIIYAFAHHDNVLSYADPLARYTDMDVTVVLIDHGQKFTTSAFVADIKNVKYGLKTANVIQDIFPPELQTYFHPRLKLWLLKLAPRKITIRNVLRNYWHLIQLARKTRNRFDVFHFNGVGIYSLFLSRIMRFARKILTIHDYVSHSGEGNAMISQANRKLVKNFRHFIQHYDFLSDEFSRYFQVDRSRVHTVRSGTFGHFRQFPPTSSPYNDYILFFGRISPYKGLKYLVEAFIQYCREYDEPDLVIAGGGDVSDILPLIADEPRIHLLNRRPTISELAGLVEGCECAVCTYTDVSHSGVVLHAYTYGKPVIANNIGGLHEVVFDGKTGVLIEDLSKESIIKGIVRIRSLIAKEPMRENIEQLNTNGVLGWKRIAQEYQRVYSLVT